MNSLQTYLLSLSLSLYTYLFSTGDVLDKVFVLLVFFVPIHHCSFWIDCYQSLVDVNQIVLICFSFLFSSVYVCVRACQSSKAALDQRQCVFPYHKTFCGCKTTLNKTKHVLRTILFNFPFNILHGSLIAKEEHVAKDRE